MEIEKLNQIEHYLKEFIKLQNSFWYDHNDELANYWKGQVMGICKVIEVLDLVIDSDYYLKQLL
jgi:hypothetical protein